MAKGGHEEEVAIYDYDELDLHAAPNQLLFNFFRSNQTKFYKATYELRFPEIINNLVNSLGYFPLETYFKITSNISDDFELHNFQNALNELINLISHPNNYPNSPYRNLILDNLSYEPSIDKLDKSKVNEFAEYIKQCTADCSENQKKNGEWIFCMHSKSNGISYDKNQYILQLIYNDLCNETYNDETFKLLIEYNFDHKLISQINPDKNQRIIKGECIMNDMSIIVNQINFALGDGTLNDDCAPYKLAFVSLGIELLDTIKKMPDSPQDAICIMKEFFSNILDISKQCSNVEQNRLLNKVNNMPDPKYPSYLLCSTAIIIIFVGLVCLINRFRIDVDFLKPISKSIEIN